MTELAEVFSGVKPLTRVEKNGKLLSLPLAVTWDGRCVVACDNKNLLDCDNDNLLPLFHILCSSMMEGEADCEEFVAEHFIISSSNT